MHGQVGLLVTFEVEPIELQWPCDWLLADRGDPGVIALECQWATCLYGKHSGHAQCLSPLLYTVARERRAVPGGSRSTPERVALRCRADWQCRGPLQGAPVTTIDFDFIFRKTPVNLRKLKALAVRLGATVLRPYYPVSDLFRVVRDDDGLQLDFMGTIHGVRSFAGLRERSLTIEVHGAPLRVAALDDIITSKRPLAGRETWRSSTYWRGRVKKPNARRKALAALRRESDRALVDLIRRRLALPVEKRMNFLRARVSFRGSAL